MQKTLQGPQSNTPEMSMSLTYMIESLEPKIKQRCYFSNTQPGQHSLCPQTSKSISISSQLLGLYGM